MNNSTLTKLQYEELKNIIKDFCVSNLGKSLLDKLLPSSNIKTVKNRLIETSEGKMLLESSTVPLQGIVNIDNIIINVEKGAILGPEALRNVSDFLRGCRKIKSYMNDKEFYAPTLMSYSHSIKNLENIEEEINNSIHNNIIDSNATKELKRIRRLIENTEIKIEEKLEGFLKSSNNKVLIQDFFITKRNGRFTIPIKASYKNQVAGTLVDTSSTGSTVFIEPAIVSKFTSELMQLKADESNEEYQILSYLTGLVREYIIEIKLNVEVIGLYDMIFAKAKYSITIQGIAPDINDYGYINIINGRHPLLKVLKGNVVPLNVSVGKDYRSLIITGPNAGGKTVVLKAIGLLTLAMQSGFHIPCEKGSVLSVFDNVFADIGDDQSIENALSTFSSHVKNIAEIIDKTSKSTLLLFDEIGSGTEPNEGAALAISILEEVYHKGAITIATTHYGEIKNFSLSHPDFENAAMLFNSETFEPLYELSVGQSGESNALWISKKMGINKNIVQRTQNYIKSKDYNYRIVNKAKIRLSNSNLEDNISSENNNYEIGDKVYLTEYKDSGLIYKPKNEYNNVTVLYDNKFIEVNVRQIRLEFKAGELYPDDYDLNSLFTSFAERKLEKDIIRGSKKALKELQKMRKQRQK